MKDPWFVVKRHGLGLSPNGWKGWTATAVFIVLFSPAAVAVQRSHGSAVALAVMALVVLAFLLVTLLTSDGKAWRWRWGKDDDALK
jgi:hypothetical protein